DLYQVAVPPALSLGWKNHRLVDLKAVIEQHEAALFPVAALVLESPVVDDHLVQPPTGRADLPISDDRDGREPLREAVRHVEQCRPLRSIPPSRWAGPPQPPSAAPSPRAPASRTPKWRRRPSAD